MEIFLSKGFFNHLLFLKAESMQSSNDTINSNCRCILELLNAENLTLYINDEWFNEVKTELTNNLLDTSLNFKDEYNRLLTTSFRKNRLRSFNQSDFPDNNPSSYYFLDNTNISKWKRNGIIMQNTFYDGTDFYNRCTQAGTDVFPGEYSELKKYAPDCNSMLFIDKYIFKNLERKLPNILDFIKSYLGNDFNDEFHLTFLCANTTIDGKFIPALNFTKAINSINEIIGVSVQIFIDNNIPTADRLFFTNYSFGNISHPFDRDAEFTQNFIGREDIFTLVDERYKKQIRELKKWKTFIAKIPEEMGIMKMKYQNKVFENRIFNL